MSALKKAQAEPAKPAASETPEPSEGEEDDDLSIPAFLRKKIM